MVSKSNKIKEIIEYYNEPQQQEWLNAPLGKFVEMKCKRYNINLSEINYQDDCVECGLYNNCDERDYVADKYAGCGYILFGEIVLLISVLVMVIFYLEWLLG